MLTRSPAWSTPIARCLLLPMMNDRCAWCRQRSPLAVAKAAVEEGGIGVLRRPIQQVYSRMWRPKTRHRGRSETREGPFRPERPFGSSRQRQQTGVTCGSADEGPVDRDQGWHVVETDADAEREGCDQGAARLCRYRLPDPLDPPAQGVGGIWHQRSDSAPPPRMRGIETVPANFSTGPSSQRLCSATPSSTEGLRSA